MSSSYRELRVWQKAMDYCEEVYRLSGKLPEQERYGLISQSRRSSVSIPANIAEGSGRKGDREFARFLKIAQGSLRETETHVLLMVRLRFVTNEEIEPAIKLAEEVGKMLTAFIAKIERDELN